MTEPGVGESDGRSRRLRCLGRFAFTVPMAAVCLQLALGGLPSAAVPVLVAVLWFWLAASVTASVVGFVRGVSGTNAPWQYFRRVPSVCTWVSLLLLAIAAAALFAAGETTLAGTIELLLFLRIAVWLGTRKSADAAKDGVLDDSFEFRGIAEALKILIVVSSLWLAFGAPAAWVESMIVTAFWIMSLVMISGAGLAAVAFMLNPEMRKRKQALALRSGGQQDALYSPPERAITPEPVRTPGRTVVMWLWRAGSLVVVWGLWSAGYPLLAGLYLIGQLMLLSMGVRERRQKHGDTARIGLFDRAVDLIIRLPLLFIGMVLFVAGGLIFGIPAMIYDRIFGTHPLQPAPETEREARIRQARIRRAAASYRLREEFGKPDGFVYFMCSEPHQRKHFLGPDGLLTDLGDRVVARGYRQHVLEARNSYNWMAFEQAPEGALLHVNGIGNMRRDLPFIALVPPCGKVQVFRLSEPYRARKRDGGAALAEAETEIRAVIMEVLGLSATEAKSC